MGKRQGGKDETPRKTPKRRGVNSRLSRVPAFAKARSQGKSQREAAELAGYSPGETARKEGQKLDRMPETIATIERLRERHDLGLDRVGRELDKGLRESMPEGKHGDYVDRLLRVNGIGQDKGGSGGEVGAIIGVLIGALDSTRAQQALQRLAIPGEASPTPDRQPPEAPAA